MATKPKAQPATPDRDSLFPKEICLAAQHSQRTTGVPACLSLAQWALESGWGRAMPADSNNCFGIKAGHSQAFVESKTQEWDNRTKSMITITAKFRKFDSVDQAFEQHAALLSDPHGPYRHYIYLMGDIYKYIPAMARTYASDPNYCAKLLKIIEDHKLTDFDLPKTQPSQ